MKLDLEIMEEGQLVEIQVESTTMKRKNKNIFHRMKAKKYIVAQHHNLVIL
jgi:hypothetical protein